MDATIPRWSMSQAGPKGLLHRLREGRQTHGPGHRSADRTRSGSRARYAHRATDSAGSSLGLIHRIVSPQNILLSWQGEVKLVDFGIAKARQKTQRTDAGVLKGKFGYMSPEQVRGLPLSNRSDLFSLGTVFWELLTGHRAFDRETDYETMDAVRAVDLPPFEQAAQAIPKALQDICLKALSKDEEERYARAEHMARDITRWLSAQDEQTSQLERRSRRTETFASQHQAERKLLASYERYGASMVETQIRSAGSERETPAVQVGVSQNRQHVLCLKAQRPPWSDCSAHPDAVCGAHARACADACATECVARTGGHRHARSDLDRRHRLASVDVVEHVAEESRSQRCLRG